MPCSYFMQVRINIPPKKEKFRGLRIRYGVISSVANKIFIEVLYKLKCCYYEIQASNPIYGIENCYLYGILASTKIRFIKMA